MSAEPPETGEKRQAGEVARLISYAALLALSLALMLNARGLPTSRWEVLGAGAFPQLVFGALAALSALAAVDALRRIGGGWDGFGAACLDWMRRRRLVIGLFALFGLYLAAIPLAGFGVATFGFLVLAQALLAPRTPLAAGVALILAVAFSFGLEALFAQVFFVILPRGVW